jgi:hypothetical protein
MSGADAGAVSTTPASTALMIGNNGNTFLRGIVFQNTGIEGTDGATGTGCAIAMAKGHVVQWFNNSGNPVSTLYSNTSDYASAQTLVFDNGGLLVQQSGDQGILLQVPPVTSAVNHLQIFGAESGNVVVLRANSDVDTDVSMNMSVQGSGVFYISSGNTAFMSVNPEGGIELGTINTVNTPYIDFHSSGDVTDYNARIWCQHGTAAIGDGHLIFEAGKIIFSATAIGNYSSDSAASAGGVPIGGIYRDTTIASGRSVLVIRMT